MIVAHRRVRDTGARAELRPVVHVALPGDRASAEDDPSDEEDDDDPDVAES